MSPRPETVRVVCLTTPPPLGSKIIVYKVFVGTGEKEISFLLDVTLPPENAA